MTRNLLIPLLFITAPLQAADMTAGDFDPQFGDQILRMGVAKPVLPDGYADDDIFFDDMEIDSEGRYLVSSWAHDSDAGPAVLVHRFLPNGEPDMAFAGGSGFIRISGNVMTPIHGGLEIASDDAIWVSYTRFGETSSVHVIQRFTAEGIEDAAFGENGTLVIAPSLGNERFIARDTAIHGDVFYTSHQVLTISAPQQFYAEVVRIKQSGIDTAFGINGASKLPTGSHIWNLRVDSENSVYVSSDHGTDQSAIFRLNAKGELDTNFHGDGDAVLADLLESVPGWQAYPDDASASVHDIRIDNEDDLLVTASACCLPGGEEELFVVRINGDDGAIDTSYGDADTGWAADPIGGRPFHYVRSALNSEGTLAVAISDHSASSLPYRLYLDDNGQPDQRYGENGIHLHDTGRLAGSIAFDEQDGLVVAGHFATVTRYLGPDEKRETDASPDALPVKDIVNAYPDSPRTQVVDVSGTDVATLATLSIRCQSSPDGDAVPCKGMNGIRVNDDDFVTAGKSTYLPPGGTLRVVTQSSKEPGGMVEATLTVGDVQGVYTVSTRDDAPDSITIEPVTNAIPGSDVIIGPITPTGFDVPVEVVRYSGEMALLVSKNETTYSSEISLSPGESFWIKARAPSVTGTTETDRIQYSPYQDSVLDVTVTTALNEQPDSINFPRKDDVPPASFITSDPATISGVIEAIAFSVENGCYFLFDSVAEIPATIAPENCTTNGSTATNAQVIVLGHTSATSGLTEVITTLHYGSASTDFTSTTAEASPEPQPKEPGGGGPVSALGLAALGILGWRKRQR